MSRHRDASTAARRRPPRRAPARALARARHDLEAATTYQAWQLAAGELDNLEGRDRWRADDASPHFDAPGLREHRATLERLRRAGDLIALAAFLQESLHRHLGDLTHAEVHAGARVGPKHVVTDYLDAVDAALDAIASSPIAGVPASRKLALLDQAAQNLGRTALMLSGGATMGLFHAGVIKALWSEGLLPRVLSGASTGAIIAAATCTRTDAELAEVFADPARIDTRVFALRSAREVAHGRGPVSHENLMRSIRANVPNLTFLEAFEKTRRILNIAVSPTRARQKPRLLNHRTAPDVLIPSAVLASSAIPLVFPPAELVARGPGGDEVPYAPGERWIDGTIHTDLPMQRISRLMNVNHFIVSQTNPHLVPFVNARRGGGLVPMTVDLALSSAQAQLVQLLGFARRHVGVESVRRVLDGIHGAADQRVMGDINIHPPVDPWIYGMVFRNASAADFERFIRLGEHATWPLIPMIRDHTRVSRTIERCTERLRRAAGSSPLAG